MFHLLETQLNDNDFQSPHEKTLSQLMRKKESQKTVLLYIFLNFLIQLLMKFRIYLSILTSFIIFEKIPSNVSIILKGRKLKINSDKILNHIMSMIIDI